MSQARCSLGLGREYLGSSRPWRLGGGPRLGRDVQERAEEVMGTSGDFDPGKSGRFPVYKPHPDWDLICGILLAMLGLVGLLVFLVQR